MKSERETLEKLEKMANVQISSQKQQEIWDNIDAEIDRMQSPTVKGRRHKNYLGTSAAAVAAVATVLIGLYAFSHRSLPKNTPASHAQPTENHNKQRTTAFNIPPIKSMTIQSDTPAAAILSPINLQSMKAQVRSLIRDGSVTTVQMPKQMKGLIFNAYIGPSRLNVVTTTGKQLSLFPAYYISKGKVDQNGYQLYTTKFIKDIVEIHQSGKITYWSDQPLYNWLKNDQWKTEFTSSTTSVQNSKLPSWLFISNSAVSSISIQGWGPGADGNFTIYPATGTSPKLINTLLDGLSNDQTIKSYRTPISTGGGEWIELKMKNGTSISLETFPNEPKPTQYIVTYDDKSQLHPRSTMISDVSGKVTSVFDAINKGKLVRQETN